MLFQFDCPVCLTRLQATTADCGRSVTCPLCGQAFPIPHYDPHTGRVTFDPLLTPKRPVESMAHLHAYASNGQAAPELVRLSDGRLVIRCRRCGQDNLSSSNICSQCGNPFAVESPQIPASWFRRVLLYGFGIAVVLSILCCLSVF